MAGNLTVCALCIVYLFESLIIFFFFSSPPFPHSQLVLCSPSAYGSDGASSTGHFQFYSTLSFLYAHSLTHFLSRQFFLEDFAFQTRAGRLLVGSVWAVL